MKNNIVFHIKKNSIIIGIFLLLLSSVVWSFSNAEDLYLPAIHSPTKTNITNNTAVLGATLDLLQNIDPTTNQTYSIIEKGICWSLLIPLTGSTQTINENETCTKEGTINSGKYSIKILNLHSGKTIYFWGYVKYYDGSSTITTINSAFDSFITHSIPTVIGPTVSSITTNSAKLVAEISSDGRSAIINKGVCLSTSLNTEYICENIDAYNTAGTININQIIFNKINLLPSTVYYYKAFAENIYGKVYTDEISFTTLAVTNEIIQKPTDFLLNLATGYSLNSTYSSIPLKWSYVFLDNQNIKFIIQRKLSNEIDFNIQYTINNTNKDQSLNKYIDTNISKGLIYDYKIKACTITIPILCSVDVYLSNISIPIESVTTASSFDLKITSNGGIMGGTTAGLKNLGSEILIRQTPPVDKFFTGWTSTDNICTGTSNCFFNMPAKTIIITANYQLFNDANLLVRLPFVSNPIFTEIGVSQVILGANITSDGGASLTERGICLSKNSNPTVCTSSGSSTGTFNQKFLGLSPDTTYFFRGYAKNIKGIGYSNDNTFRTNQIKIDEPIIIKTEALITATKPNIPNNLRLNNILSFDSKKIELIWNDYSNKDVYFKIRRNQIDYYKTEKNIYFFADLNIKPGVKYLYRVSACINETCSEYSSPIETIIPLDSTESSIQTNEEVLKQIEVLKSVNTIEVSTKIINLVENIDNLRINISNIKNELSLYINNSTSIILKESNISNNKEEFNLINSKKNYLLKIVSDSFNNLSNITQTDINNLKVLINKGINEMKGIALYKGDLINSNYDDYFDKFNKTINENSNSFNQEDVSLMYKDTNNDGVSDYDSIYIYNIDPNTKSIESSYGGKKINAGEKILLGFNPQKIILEQIVLENPIDSTASTVESYKINSIELKSPEKIFIKGQALPNSFITLYIFSTPTIVTIKTDSNGEWQYVLNKELEDGSHQIYTATVDNTGNIIAKSSGYSFTKTAEAIVPGGIPIAEAATESLEPSLVNTRNILFISIFISLIVGISLIIMGISSKKENLE